MPCTLTVTWATADARRPVSPATWNTRSTPRIARRTERRSRMSPRTNSTSRPSSVSTGDRARTSARTSSPRSTSLRVTWDPRSPVAPVTSVVIAAIVASPRPGRSVGLRAMPPVAIVTDSTHYLPREVVAAHGIAEVSLYVDDGDGPAPRERHHRLRRLLRRPARDRPRCRPPRSRRSATSSPSTSRWREAGRDIVSIHLSGGISGTVESARQAARRARRAPPRPAASRSSTRGWPAARSARSRSLAGARGGRGRAATSTRSPRAPGRRRAR